MSYSCVSKMMIPTKFLSKVMGTLRRRWAALRNFSV